VLETQRLRGMDTESREEFENERERARTRAR